MELRSERAGDQPGIGDLHVAAFGEHGRKVCELVEALRVSVTAGDGLALVAEEGGKIVGHVMFTPSLLDAPRRLVEVRVLSPVAVRPELQGQSIGSALIRSGLQEMADRRVPVVFLEGPPAYYSRFGFAPGDGQGFRKPSLRIPDAAFQALCLPTCESWMTGTLVYSEAFWRCDAVGLRDPNA